MPDIELTVTMQSRQPHPTVWLELDYDGIQPPVELFSDLEMIGWKPPAPASPPATAIDWSNPDPVTGEDFTINSWKVEGAIVRPPEGSGFRGHWTAGESAAFLRSVEGVLARHHLFGGPSPTEATPAAVEPEPDVVVAEPAIDLTSLPAPPTARAEPAPVEQPVAAAPLPGAGAATSVLRAEVGAQASRDGIVEALAPLGVTAHFATATKLVTTSYRGSSYEREVAVSVVEVLVDDSLADVASAVLRDLGLIAEVHAAPSDQTASGVERVDAAR